MDIFFILLFFVRYTRYLLKYTLQKFTILFLSAATGFEFGDNRASVPKTDENGVAQISFQVHIHY